MLRLILNCHPELGIPTESHFLIPLLQQYDVRSLLSPTEVDSIWQFITDHPRFSAYRSSAEQLQSAYRAVGEPTLRKLIDATFRLEAATMGKPRWGEKTPSYTPFVQQLHDLFPDALFVHIVRDGRDVSISLRNELWGGWTEYERARYWSHMVRCAESVGKRIGPDRYMRVTYEELVLHPEPTVRSLCQFLGVDFDASMLDFHKTAFDHISADEKLRGHHEKLKRPSTRSDVARWKRESSWLRVLLFESIAGPTIDQIGVERRFTGALRCLTGIASAAYHTIGGCLAGIRRVYWWMPERVRIVFRRNHLLRKLWKTMTRC
jgi:hypothetical protein